MGRLNTVLNLIIVGTGKVKVLNVGHELLGELEKRVSVLQKVFLAQVEFHVSAVQDELSAFIGQLFSLSQDPVFYTYTMSLSVRPTELFFLSFFPACTMNPMELYERTVHKIE